MARPVILSKTLLAADNDCIALDQTVSGGAEFDLDGASVTGGVATLDTQRRVLLTFASDESTNSFVITGTAENGVTISETVDGGATSSASSRDFFTITSVVAENNTAGNVKIGTNTTGSTRWLPLNAHIAPATTKMGAVVAGTVTYSAEYTYNDPNSVPIPTAWSVTGMSAQTTNKDGGVEGVAAVRLTVTSGTGSVEMTVIQEGIRGN